MKIKELIKEWESRLKKFEDRPIIAKGMDERTAMGCQHGRTTTLKQCIEELKTKMKVEVTPAKPDFQPVTMSITIESFAELAVLYARFNCPVAIIKQHGFGDGPLTARLERAAADFNEDTDEVFDHISDIAKGYHNKQKNDKT